MKRILRNLFSAENDGGAAPDVRANAASDNAAATATDTVEYTDGSQSYSYEQSEDASAANNTRSHLAGAIAYDNTRSRAVQPAASHATSNSASHVAKDANADSNAEGNGNVRAKPRRRVNGKSAGVEDGSESSRYSLRPRRNGAVVRQGGSNSDRPTLSAGSVSQRDLKRASSNNPDKPPDAKLNPVAEPAIALRTMPHAASARTTSGVVGRPGRVTAAQVEKATHSTLRNLCAELGLPAAGTKAQLRERALNKISEHTFDGEVVQSLSAPPTSDTCDEDKSNPPRTPAPNDTATTTIEVARGNEVQRSGGPPASNINTPSTPNTTASTAELSSTALFKFDPAEPAHARRQLFRGNTPQAPTGEESISAPAVSKHSATVPHTSATSGDRPPTGLQTPRTSSGVAVNRRRHSVRAGTSHALESACIPAPATSTHLSGVRIDPSGAAHTSNKPELHPGVDTMSPGGEKLPSCFAGAEGGPPDMPQADSVDRNRQEPQARPSASPSGSATPAFEQAQAHAGTYSTAYASTPTARPNAAPRPSAATPAPSLPPLRPMPRRSPASALASPGDILRSYNDVTPRALASVTPQSTTDRASMFLQGSRPSSERFPSRMSGPLSQRDKRSSLRAPRLPFADAHFTPDARRPRSTGISSFPSTAARGGQLTDLRPSTEQAPGQAPPLVALNGLHRRDQPARAPRMAQDTARIVAAIRRTAQEHRHLCRSTRPMQPIGPPPSLKRPRDDEDIPRRPGKRSRTNTGTPATAAAPQSTPRSTAQMQNPRPPPPTVAELQSAPPGTIMGQRRSVDARASVGPTRSAASIDHTQGILRSKSVAGIDRKRRFGVGRSEEDAGVMKRSAKRRSLSFAADSQIRKEVTDALAKSTQQRASNRRSVSFAEPFTSLPPPAPEPAAQPSTTPALGNLSPVRESTPSSQDHQKNAENATENSEAIKKATPEVEVAEKEQCTLPEPVTVSVPAASAPFGNISFGIQSQPAEKPPGDAPATASAATPAPESVPQTTVGDGEKRTAGDDPSVPAVEERNVSNEEDKKEESPTKVVSFAKSAPSFGSVSFGQPKDTEQDSDKTTPGVTASAPASSIFGQPSSSAATFGIVRSAPANSSASVLGASSAAVSFGASSSSTAFGNLSSSPAFGQKSPATSQQASASSSAAASVTTDPPTFSAPVTNQEKSAPEESKVKSAPSSAPSMAEPTTQAAIPFSSTPFGSKPPEPESSPAVAAPISAAAPSLSAASSTPFGSASSSAFAFSSSAPTFGASTPAQSSGALGSSAPALPFGTSAPSSTPFGTSALALGVFGSSAQSSTPFGSGASSAAFNTSTPFESESKPAGLGTESKPTFGTQSSTPAPSTTDVPFSSFATPKTSKANPFAAFGAGSGAGGGPFGNTPATKGPYLFDVKPDPPSTPIGASSSNPFNSSGASFGASGAMSGSGFGASTPNAGGGFGSSTPNARGGFGSGPFGGNNSSGPFGGGNNNASGPFGGGNSGGFGTSAPNGTGSFGFGSNDANPFVTPTTNGSGGGHPFGSNSGGNAFGGFGGGSHAASGGFGGGGQPASGFGHAAAPMGSIPFGQPQQQQPTPQLSQQANMFQQAGAGGANQFNMGAGGGPTQRGRRMLRAKRTKR